MPAQSIRYYMNLLESSSTVTLQSLVDEIEHALKSDKDSSFTMTSQTKIESPEFGGATVEFIQVPFVKGDESVGVNSLTRLNAIIDKFFRDYRAKGYIFTQPKSVKMEKMYDGSTHGTLEFTVGIPKD